MSGLGNTAKSPTPPGGFAAGYRIERFRRRQVSARWLVEDARETMGLDPHTRDGFAKPPRPATCRWSCAPLVGVHHDEAHPAHFSGVIRCGSIWACPVCSGVIRSGRSAEVTTAAQRWEAEHGGSFLFITFTVRHKLGDSLTRTFDAVIKAFTSLVTGNPWKRFRDRCGIIGQIKTVEVTFSWDNGWHAHLHVLFFTKRVLSGKELSAGTGWLLARWQKFVVKHGGRCPNEHGVDVRRIQNGEVVGAYLTKLQDHHTKKPRKFTVGNEMARIDLKHGHLDSLVPFKLLDIDAMEPDEAEANKLAWLEYVASTRGRRAVVWSRGLKELLGVDERTDEDILDDTEAAQLHAVIPKRLYAQWQNSPDDLARILEYADADDWDGLCARYGASLVVDTVR